jgi:hypothetical protein
VIPPEVDERRWEKHYGIKKWRVLWQVPLPQCQLVRLADLAVDVPPCCGHKMKIYTEYSE